MIALAPRRRVVTHLREGTAPDRDWDRLTLLAADAWTWRDLESLDLLAESLRQLRVKVREEWGE